MQKLIRNQWTRAEGAPFATARILDHEVHPEGLDVERVRFFEPGKFDPDPAGGHIVSTLRGSGKLRLAGDSRHAFHLEPGVHLYLPPGSGSVVEAAAGAEFLKVSGGSAEQARGTRLLLRDEAFLAACAHGAHSFRWILTPQYLSRRIFLHHDPVLLSKSGNPVSWFRTTMFDTTGLPRNDEGEPVFKMSYNSRTEFNVCYDVTGTARLRTASHPYSATRQRWEPWLPLDSESTYHLNEASGGPEEECVIDPAAGIRQYFRNKHEVRIANGHVTLFCLFDPAPCGVERHRPGEYSDYEPLSGVLGTRAFQDHLREIGRYDEMLDQLSLARALGMLSTLHGTPVWEQYLQGRKAQFSIEAGLAQSVSAPDTGRAAILAQWMQPAAELLQEVAHHDEIHAPEI